MQLILPELLRLQEGEQLDFKQRISSLEKIAKTICAFANTKGGMLLVGIKDDHTVTGIDPEEEKYMLEQAATNFCEPPIPLRFEEIEDADDQIVLVVHIDESTKKPHSCRNSQGEWQVYVRQGDQSIPAGRQLSRRLEKGLEQTPPPEAALSKYERDIMAYIHMHERITVKQLTIMLNFSKRRAQRLLQQMVEKGLIRQYEQERYNFYA